MTEYFAYPQAPHKRKHGPSGYQDYENYRQWLRDEFTFRCVYCMTRELWVSSVVLWEIDHLIPQADSPEKILDYENLIYACRDCNLAKGKRPLPNPCELSLCQCMRVDEDGTIHALNKKGIIIIGVLGLNGPKRTRERRKIIRTLKCLQEYDPDAWKMWMKYPDDLPNLKNLHPKSNSKPEGVENCYFKLREKGLLPETY